MKRARCSRWRYRSFTSRSTLALPPASRVSAQLAYLQAPWNQSGALGQSREVIRLQGRDAAALGLALQRHGADPPARRIVEADGGPGQQAIRMLEPGRGEGDRLPDEAALAGHPKCLFGLISADDPARSVSRMGSTRPILSLHREWACSPDGQIARLDGDTLAPGRFGQPCRGRS